MSTADNKSTQFSFRPVLTISFRFKPVFVAIILQIWVIVACWTFGISCKVKCVAVTLLEKPFIWIIEIEKFAPYCPWLIVFSAVERLRPCINTTIQSHITMQPVLCRLPFAKKFVFVCGIQNTRKFFGNMKKNHNTMYHTVPVWV